MNKHKTQSQSHCSSLIAHVLVKHVNSVVVDYSLHDFECVVKIRLFAAVARVLR